MSGTEIKKRIRNLFERWHKDGSNLSDIKKFLKKNTDVLVKEINYVEQKQYGDDYIKNVLEFLDEVYMDMESLTEKKIIKFGEFVNEGVDYSSLGIEQVFGDIGYSENDKDILAQYFKTREEFIDSKDAKYCVYTITDFKTDITKNNRTTFDSLILEENKVIKMQGNIINKIISETYAQIPDETIYLNIKVKTHSLLDKDKLNDAIENIITIKKTIEILTSMTGYEYCEKFGSHHIWKK